MGIVSKHFPIGIIDVERLAVISDSLEDQGILLVCHESKSILSCRAADIFACQIIANLIEALVPVNCFDVEDVARVAHVQVV